MDETTFACPQEMQYCSARVFEGEYDLPYLPKTPPTILDIGANCGAFALWASERWQGSKIFAYEPAQINFRYLTENVAGRSNIITEKKAVLASGHTKLYVGRHNQGEASFYPELNQTDDTYEVPEQIHPLDLPKAQILKVDTEGCELQIIARYLHQQPDAILFEYHRDEDRRTLDTLLIRDYALVGGQILCEHRGTLKYLRRGI